MLVIKFVKEGKKGIVNRPSLGRKTAGACKDDSSSEVILMSSGTAGALNAGWPKCSDRYEHSDGGENCAGVGNDHDAGDRTRQRRAMCKDGGA